MKVKIDTKEKFNVICVEEDVLAANMTEAMQSTLLPFSKGEPRHVVLKLNQVKKIDEGAAKDLANVQQYFYENDCSFVICEMHADVEKVFDDAELLEVMNVTPTESEAWDIVQMEEIERELLS
jgi:anti-anti-sigma factor